MKETYKPNPPHGFKWLIPSCPVVGIEYHKRAIEAYILSDSRPIVLRREPNNIHDPNAIAVIALVNNSTIGHLPKEVAYVIASKLPADTPLECAVRRIESGYKVPYFIDIAIFAETDTALSGISLDCQDAIESRFSSDDKNEDDINDQVSVAIAGSQPSLQKKDTANAIGGCGCLIVIAIALLIILSDAKTRIAILDPFLNFFEGK
jgi:HIRAN domain